MEAGHITNKMKSISLTKMIFVLTLTSSEGGPWLPGQSSPALMALHRGGSSSLEQPLNCTNLMHSVWSVPGERQYMEDEYYVSGDGSFAAVFDGHGGSAVSRYLRQNLYANYQAALPTSQNMHNLAEGDEQFESAVSSALRSAFRKVDKEVQSIVHWSFQGSTACAVVIQENIASGTRSIISANVGDSRAVLSRNGTAIELTKDHKPNNVLERERVEALGGSVDWCGELNEKGEPIEDTGVYRINGNLALSRSIGDRCERPWVSSDVDISHNTVDEDSDSFVLLASDGLFDVMTSQDAVSFIHEQLTKTKPEDHQYLRKNIARLVADEALKRGTLDNVTVLVLWFLTKEINN
ncbi:hypothetical protein HJC23_006671 [Cyclotella cryptica]|uniref:PPM-type phosphatase domain-containing protein n=1 Tax=Cyclotella cryptica TaxID=29204 RepID=A0ABD3QY13_9STRA|eukprot:CCRYP_001103-RA/>CCRYP_001103-RA protein AED:0.08 eAED:0.08 QI:139/1/1/1/1/1/5/255/351